MSATPSHHAVCAPVSERHVCCYVLLSLSLCVGLFLGPALTRQSGAANSSSPSISSPSSSDNLITFFFNSIQFCLFTPSCFSVFCCFTSAQCCRPYRLVESGLTTHCPCQLITGPVSSRQTHMSIVYTPLFTPSLIAVPSRVFRMCGFFSTMFPVRTTFCIEMRGLTTFALLTVMHL